MTGIIQSEDLRSWEANDVSLSLRPWKGGRRGGLINPDPSLKVWESEKPIIKGRKRMSQHKQSEQICHSSAFLFYSGSQQVKWSPQPWWKKASLLRLLIQMLISSWHRLIDTPRNNVLQFSGHSLAQSGWYITLTITIWKYALFPETYFYYSLLKLLL